MKIIVSILTSTITVIFAIIGGIWTAFTVLNATMDSKIAEAKTTMRTERVAQIGEVRAEIVGIKELVQSVDSKVDILISRREK